MVTKIITYMTIAQKNTGSFRLLEDIDHNEIEFDSQHNIKIYIIK